MKLEEIQHLIKFVAKSGVSEVELEIKDFKIRIQTTAGKLTEQVFVQAPPAQVIQAAAPVAVQQTAPTQDIKTPEIKITNNADESKYLIIKSPMIGTFYRSGGPDKPVFVNVGDDIMPGKTVCIIEAMKLFNEIEADMKGKVVKILVNDATPVEYDQPLFLIDPS